VVRLEERVVLLTTPEIFTLRRVFLYLYLTGRPAWAMPATEYDHTKLN
jgi:hypothetical protein